MGADERDRHQDHQCRAHRHHVLPPAAVEAAGDPHHRAGGVVHVARGQQVLGQVARDRRDPHPDQDHPEALDALAPRQRVDEHPEEQPSGQRRDRDADLGHRSGQHPAERDHRDRADAGAPGDPEDVGAGQRVARHGLEDRARQRQRRADEHRRQRPGQSQVQHDEPVAGPAAAQQDVEDLPDREREVAPADVHRHGQRQQDEAAHHQYQRPPAQRPGERAEPQPLARLHDRRLRDVHRGAHSFTSFLRRTSAMKKGAPNTAIMMPTSSSAGRATTRPRTSATRSSAAPSRPEQGSSQR